MADSQQAGIPPPGAIPLDDVSVRARPGGAPVYAQPDPSSARLGQLTGDSVYPARAALVTDRVWLQVAWPDAAAAWMAGDDTDFPRSPAYTRVAAQWAESEPVLAYRRGLLRDILTARQTSAERIAQAVTLRGDALQQAETSILRPTMVPAYGQFWDYRERLGLPDPFDTLPVHTVPPAALAALELLGFGPNTDAFEFADVFYADTRGMLPGIDLLIAEGSPLIAVADGDIVDFDFLTDPSERSLALRPYLPERFNHPDGSRALSDVIIGYGHLTGDPTSNLAAVGDTVRAGQIIGTAGWPVHTEADGTVSIQRNNARLRIEAHLVGSDTLLRLNPLLLWTPRLVAFMARLAAHSAYPPYPTEGQPWGRLGFFALGAFRDTPPTSVWHYQPTPDAIWPEGVYDMNSLLEWVRALPAR